MKRNHFGAKKRLADKIFPVMLYIMCTAIGDLKVSELRIILLLNGDTLHFNEPFRTTNRG